MTMTRKDFEALASALSGARPYRSAYETETEFEAHIETWRKAARSIACACHDSNAEFNLARFFKACGYGEESNVIR